MNDFLNGSKVIAAVRSQENYQECLKSDCKVVFLLFGTLLTVPEYIKELKAHGKTVFIHLDLIEGLSSSRSSIDYINEKTAADGIISIKQNLLKYAKSLGFLTVLRIFMLDSKSVDSLEKIDVDSAVDIIEMMPGIVVTVLKSEVNKNSKTIIAGGLISSEDDVRAILQSGVGAVSTSASNLWNMQI
ncbi:MAG: glycerol-3-phosphate responsive antiterminator [Treponema sp.]|nr:glycerol-3-phosphate responsive antiterminator [Treponema sp.]